MAEMGERGKPGEYRKESPAPTLSDLGISRDLSSHATAMAKIPEDEFETTLAEHRTEQQAATGRMMERLVSRAHVVNNSGENEWYTPERLIPAAHFGVI